MRTGVIIVAALLGTIAAPAVKATQRCIIERVQVCGPERCEEKAPGATYVVVDRETGRYGRCDGSLPCDWYPATFSSGGIWINIAFASGPQGAKLSIIDNRLLEVVSLNETVIVNRAQCGGEE